MRVELLEAARLEEFRGYCRAHRHEVDESFLYDEHLMGFAPGGENPACVAVEGDRVVGTAALIIDEYMRRGSRARFRIFHAEAEEYYGPMLGALLPFAAGLEHLFIFAPEQNAGLRAALEGLGFSIERYTFLLMRDCADAPEAGLPEGFALRAFEPGRDEQVWCNVRNGAFAALLGSQTPMTVEMAAALLAGPDALAGGAMVLMHGDEPVGVVRVAEDDFEGRAVAEIGPLAIVPGYQGRGLGRALLRHALRFAHSRGYGQAVLCVNAENERAAALYLQEGFKKVETVVCYRYELPAMRFDKQV